MRAIVGEQYQVDSSKLRQQLDEAHLAWQQERREQQEEFTLENVRFEHQEGWDRKFLSIQSAHDGNHLIWKFTKAIWTLMGGSV